MKTVTFALLADTHLCRSQYGRTIRRIQIRRALENAINAARDAGVKYILHAGDLLDSNSPGVGVAIEDLLTIHKLLCQHEMTMWVLRGNHDNCDPSWWSAIEAVETSPYGIKSAVGAFDVEGINIWASDWSTENVIRQSLNHPDFGNFDIAMFHGEIAELVKYPTEFAIPSQEFFNEKEFLKGKWPSLIVVGHVHTQYEKRFAPAAQNEQGYMLLISPGSTDTTVKPTTPPEEPAKMITVTFALPEDKRPYIIASDTIKYLATCVRLTTIMEEEDIQRFIQQMKTDAAAPITQNGIIYYISYNPQVKGCIPRIQDAITLCNLENKVTLVTQADQEVSLEDLELEGVDSARTIKTSPAQYFLDNRQKYLTHADDQELVRLCAKILTPTENGKHDLDLYLESKIEEV